MAARPLDMEIILAPLCIPVQRDYTWEAKLLLKICLKSPCVIFGIDFVFLYVENTIQNGVCVRSHAPH